MAITYGSGAQIFLGYGAETTPGTLFGGSPTFIPVNPDQVSLNYDAGRQALKLGMGTIFNDFTAVEYEAKGNGSVEFPLWGSLGQGLLALCGLAGGPIVLPSYVSLFISRVAAELEYPGCRCKMISITANSRVPVTVKVDFDFIGTPTSTTVPSSPVFVSEKPFVWSDMLPATVISGNANAQNLDNIKIDINFNQALFYGNHGSNLPSHLITTDVEIKGSFSRLFEDVAEYALYNAHCMIPGDINFAFTSSCPLAGGHTVASSVVFDMPNCVYTKQSFKNPLKGPITEDYDFIALATTGASPLSYTVVAEH